MQNRATGPVCLQCGMVAAGNTITFCRRCGLSIGAAPRAEATLPTCPICYATVGDDGRLPSHRAVGGRLDLVEHMAEHDQYPVGDDEFLESLRVGDLIRIGRWQAPYDLVRRYLVTGAIDGGRRRSYQHSAIVTAMSQIKRWGADAEIFGDQEEWRAARAAVSALLERYQRGMTPGF
ncbi:MAG TPA: hypothetical protein VGJ71_06360 [Candidatus Limnocylindrales bacterium]